MFSLKDTDMQHITEAQTQATAALFNLPLKEAANPAFQSLVREWLTAAPTQHCKSNNPQKEQM